MIHPFVDDFVFIVWITIQTLAILYLFLPETTTPRTYGRIAALAFLLWGFFTVVLIPPLNLLFGLHP